MLILLIIHEDFFFTQEYGERIICISNQVFKRRRSAFVAVRCGRKIFLLDHRPHCRRRNIFVCVMRTMKTKTKGKRNGCGTSNKLYQASRHLCHNRIDRKELDDVMTIDFVIWIVVVTVRMLYHHSHFNTDDVCVCMFCVCCVSQMQAQSEWYENMNVFFWKDFFFLPLHSYDLGINLVYQTCLYTWIHFTNRPFLFMNFYLFLFIFFFCVVWCTVLHFVLVSDRDLLMTDQ